MGYRAVEKCLHPFRFVPEHLKIQEMCNKAVEENPYQLGDFPDHLKNTKISIKAFDDEPEALKYVPDHHKTEKMCKEAVRRESRSLYDVPDYFKTPKMCDQAVASSSLQFISDWFVTQEQLKIWYDDDYWDKSAFIIQWYDDYKKRKAQKAKIKEELLPIAWHPSRYWDWCISEDEKKETEKL